MMTQAAAQDPQLRPIKDLIDGMNRAAPGLMTYFLVMMAVGTVLSVMLLTGGIGLLRLRNWARVLCILVAIAELLLQTGSFIYNAAVLQPAMEQAQKEMLAKAGAQAPPANPFANTPISVVTSLAGVAFYIVLLIFLFQPRIVAAFHKQDVPEEAPTERERPPSGQYYDDEDGTSTAIRGD
jgi:hypothetical protein